jgi:hypothetical protein
MSRCKLLCLLLAVIEITCSSPCKKEGRVLALDRDKSVIADSTFYINQIIIDYPTCDSFLISKRFNQGFFSANIYTVENRLNIAFENKVIKNFDGKILGIEKIVAFAKKDTSNIYTLNLDKYPPVFPKGSENMRYKIMQVSNNQFAAIRENIADTLFRDTIYYDSEFNIEKISIRDRNNFYFFIDVELIDANRNRRSNDLYR